jgi:AraC family transcriptional regulator of adaptative response/methylated-DNA-[protein]-cysteine methyltransferase
MLTDYQRIENIIRYLGENFREQPNLDQLAERVHLSTFHFQRLFKKWVGISPKKFIQFLTLDYARKLLNESRDLLSTSIESGLSGPGRLYDLFISVESVTPGEYKQKGEGLTIAYGFHQSPFGYCLLGITQRGICSLSFHDTASDHEAIQYLNQNWPRAILKHDPKRTLIYFDKIFGGNDQNNLDKIPLHLEGTNFQLKVWEALLRIPSGHLVCYEDIAHLIHQPKAVRAVGQAIARNPISLLIPCHRVIQKMGNFGNYQWGSTRKKMLIAWEAGERSMEDNSRKVFKTADVD